MPCPSQGALINGVGLLLQGLRVSGTECQCNLSSFPEIHNGIDRLWNKCNLFLIVTDKWILINVMTQPQSQYVSVLSSHLSQTSHILIWCQNRQLYGYQIHIFGCYGNMLVSMTTYISLLTSYSSFLHLPYPNAMLKGHYRTLRKFFDPHSNCCQGNQTKVFFPS